MKKRKRRFVVAGKVQELSIAHPQAAGVDIGSRSHFVAVPPGTSEETVREFGNCTEDLEAMADWLKACGVTVVAMESTGVYWIAVYEVLESRGFKVLLVNPFHVRNVSGRKSDVLDCQWLQQLMSYGLLRGAFRPPDSICVLRAMVRQRGSLLKDQARHVQHMQKAMTQMNIQLATVISDVAGDTGQRIVRAIVAGERDPKILAGMRNARIHAGQDEIARSLEGTWRHEHLFALKQALAGYDFIRTQLSECDVEIKTQMVGLKMTDDQPGKQRRRSRSKNAPAFELHERLFQMTGVDLTLINGLEVTTVLTVLSEVGTDMARFPTVRHFTSWLGLCPGTHKTGGKVLHGRTKKVMNRATLALKIAAANLRSSKSALGAYFQRMCGRMDTAKAVTAAAHKLARLIYTMLTKGEQYVDRGQQYYEQKYQEHVVHGMQLRAARLGYKLVPVADGTPTSN